MKHWLVYDFRQEIQRPDGTVKTFKVNLPPVVTDNVDKLKKKLLDELKKVDAYKDCSINVFVSYQEIENEFLS